MSSINSMGNAGMHSQNLQQNPGVRGEGGRRFADVIGRVADGALATVSRVAPLFPGGQFVAMAADGLRDLKDSTPESLLGGGQDQQMSEMFEMQKQSQAFNLQYLQLQTELQDDNRRFSTLTNLMKVRHDTAKSAINNMHA